MNSKYPAKIEKFGLAAFVMRRILTGTSTYEVTKELNVIAEDRKLGVIFSKEAVPRFLKRCGMAFSIYQQDIVKKTLEPIVDLVKEASNSIARLVRAAEEADNQREIRDLVVISKELHNGLRLLGEMQKKLAPPEIHITQVNALILGIADKIEQSQDIPLNYRRSVLRLLAESLPAVGDLATGAKCATKALAERTTGSKNIRGTEE